MFDVPGKQLWLTGMSVCSKSNSVQGITWRLGMGLDDPSEPEGEHRGELLRLDHVSAAAHIHRVAKSPGRCESSPDNRHVREFLFTPMGSHTHGAFLQCQQSACHLGASREERPVNMRLAPSRVHGRPDYPLFLGAFG